ncbi:MAG: alpha-ketoglutarate-dependent dioxygenase AlkB [Kofleriaceae bacterium]
MQRQLDLFSTRTSGFDAGFSALRRQVLAHGAWVDHQPGWVSGHDALFEQLERELGWTHERRKMYDRTVDVPRLLATVPVDRAGFVLIEQMRRALSERYGEQFIRVTAALYRDGNDSVAWHGDTTARTLIEATVATVSLGEPRRFLLRPVEGGTTLTFSAGRGDLIVMGGTCQRTWRHAVPKTAHPAGPRIALMFRPGWAASY